MTATLLSLQSVASARRYYAAGYWQDDTFYSLARKVSLSRPGAMAFADASGSVTWAEALDWTDRIAQRLQNAELVPGDRVAIWAPSRIESALIILACSRSGYVAQPSIHRDHTLDEAISLLERSRAKAIFVESGYGAALCGRDQSAEIRALPCLRHVEMMEPLVAGSGISKDRRGLPEDVQLSAPQNDPDAISFLAFTSGTTGQPKGVMHSSNTYLSNARAIVADYSFDNTTVTYTLSPMSHNMGTVSLAITLICGGALVLHGPADARRMKQRIIETGAEYLVGVPTHGLDLIGSLEPGETLGMVRVFQLAGAAVPFSLVRALAELGVVVQNTYGMTENCSFLYSRIDDHAGDISDGWSRTAAGMEIAILNAENGTGPLAHMETGEIGIRGCSQMLGYFDDQYATEDAIAPDGWFLSGDLGVSRDDGSYRVVGRKKDLVIRGGHNIHPAPVEDMAISYPGVLRAAAFAVPDERLGEKMCLAIVASPGKAPEAAKLLSHLGEQGLSPYDMPEYFLVLDSFPLTASGKILKRAISQMVANGECSVLPCRYSTP